MNKLKQHLLYIAAKHEVQRDPSIVLAYYPANRDEEMPNKGILAL